MYAVVYKGRVIVGPMQWNRALYQGSLARQGVTASLPRVAPTEWPLVINDDAKIVPVEETRPEINDSVEYYYGPLWTITEDKATANYEVHDAPIESARSNLKQIAAGERWRRETAGTKITVQGQEVTVDTTREGRNIFVQKLNIMNDGDTVNWKFAEGWLNITKLELAAVVSAADNYVQSCFDWEKTISDQLDAANTKQELLAVEIIEPPAEPQTPELEPQ